MGELKDVSLADIDALLNVNVRAPFIARKAALAQLTRGGRIIDIGSYVAERVPSPVLSVYAATKSALAAFTKALARELGTKEDIANVVAFLASAKALCITGATLTVDGGANASTLKTARWT